MNNILIYLLIYHACWIQKKSGYESKTLAAGHLFFP